MDVSVLERAYEREKLRRVQAEAMLETKSRDLFLSYEKLNDSYTELERINKMLKLHKSQLLALHSEHDSVTSDLRLAAKLQEQILPESQSYNDVDTVGLSKPARYVAGDIYDHFKLSESSLAFYMADVTGHGPAAAMISYAIHKQLNPKSGGLCATNYRKSQNIGEVVAATVSELNMEYAGIKGDSHYFTLIYGILNLDSGDISFCQAGHPAPILFSESIGLASEVGEGGCPIGMFKHMEYTAYQCTLEPGDSLYLYSDGITECFSETGEEYGKQQLLDIISDKSRTGLNSTLNCIEGSVTDWNTDATLNDDVSILAFKRN